VSAPRLLFAGTPDFAVPALSALIGGGWSVVGVYTQPDRPSGRGRRLTPSPVKQVALNAGLDVFQPASLKTDAARATMQALAPDLMVVAAYGLILPPAILACPRLGCVNIHASLLPRWRGAAPIQRAIAAGDPDTGISLMRMEQGLDTGPVFVSQRTRIAPRETGGSLHDRLAALGAKLLLDHLPAICEQTLVPAAQDEQAACYAAKLEKSEAAIDWRRTAEELDRQIRAFNPWPVAQTRLDDETLRIWEARPLDAPEPGQPATSARPGTIVGSGPEGIDVATGNGLLRIQRLQMPGKRAIAAADLARARVVDGRLLG
jgi:methionyl-tRNA formyltransferase